MDRNRSKSYIHVYPVKLANGYVLPEGKLTPNALFVGGIDFKVNHHEMIEFFERFGPVKEVKIISYRGLSKGYGFVYFIGAINILLLLHQQISFKGRQLKLGPAIMKERNPRSSPSRQGGTPNWVATPAPCVHCTCYSQLVGGQAPSQAPPAVVQNTGCNQQPSYAYNNYGGVGFPPQAVNHSNNSYTYQYSPTANAPPAYAPPTYAQPTYAPPTYAPPTYSPPRLVPDPRPRPVLCQTCLEYGVETIMNGV